MPKSKHLKQLEALRRRGRDHKIYSAVRGLAAAIGQSYDYDEKIGTAATDIRNLRRKLGIEQGDER